MEEKMNGVCGEHVIWEFEPETGVMRISGSGPMTAYDRYVAAPWKELRTEIKSIVVEEGVTSISDYSFLKCVNAKTISIPSTVKFLGYHSLNRCKSLTKVEVPEGVRVLESRAFSGCEGMEEIKLPASLKAIDMKCFPDCNSLKKVIYAGTEEMWNRIRISNVLEENTPFLAVHREYEGRNTACEEDELDKIWHREKKEVIPVLDIAREILEQGGDGRMHILAFENRMHPGIAKKSGDATLVILPDGQTLMIDTGDFNIEDKMLGKLKRLNIRSLDHFTVSHSHGDHIGNGIAVANYLYEQGGKIGTYYYISERIGKFEPQFSDYIREHGTKMNTDLRQGDSFELGAVRMDILGPTAKGRTDYEDNINNLSVIMKLTYGKSSYLTSGDLFRGFERKVLEEIGDQLKADVMKANHHGIITSNDPEWIAAVDPVLVLAHHDDIGSTMNSEKIKARGIGYFTTGLNGTMMVSMSADGAIEVITEYGDTWSWKSRENTEEA